MLREDGGWRRESVERGQRKIPWTGLGLKEKQESVRQHEAATLKGRKVHRKGKQPAANRSRRQVEGQDR